MEPTIEASTVALSALIIISNIFLKKSSDGSTQISYCKNTKLKFYLRLTKEKSLYYFKTFIKKSFLHNLLVIIYISCKLKFPIKFLIHQLNN